MRSAVGSRLDVARVRGLYLTLGSGPAILDGPLSAVRPESVIEAARKAGLVLVSREAVPPFQYLLVFGRPTSRQSTGMTPDAAASFTTSGTTNGAKPEAIAAANPR